MADVNAYGTPSATLMQNGIRFAVASPDPDIIYMFVIDATSFDLLARKSTDGGATWSTAATISSATITCFSIWAEWWNGGSGTRILVYYHDSVSDDFLWRTLDTADDSLGTERSVNAASTDPTVLDLWTFKVEATGRIYVGGHTLAGNARYYSDDDGVNWSAYTNFGEAANDFSLGLPGNYSDPDDYVVYYHDISANELSYKPYDASANTIGTEVSVFTGVVEASQVNSPQFFTAVPRPDGKHYVFAWDAYDTGSDDLKAALVDPSTGTVTALTSVITGAAETFGVAASVDWATGDIYVFYFKGGTAAATVQIYYKVSTDDGSTWSSETLYSEDAADDFRCIWVDPGSTNYLISPAWFDDDDNDIFVNANNAIPISGGPVNASITGVSATMDLAGGAGAVLIARAVTGERALMDLAALEGTVVTQRIATITGEQALMDLAAGAGSVLVARTVPGEPALMDLDALPGTVLMGRLVAGEVALLDLAAGAGAVAAIRNAAIAGEPAVIDLVANEGIVGSLDVLIAGEPASIDFLAHEGVAAAIRIASITGAHAGLFPPTNLCTNGHFEVNTSGWSTGGSNTIERSEAQARFGAASLLATYQDHINLAFFGVTVPSAGVYSMGTWVYIPTAYDGTGIRVQFNAFTGASAPLHADADLGVRDAWQWVEVIGVTIDAGDLTGSLLVKEVSAATPGRFIYVDGVQCVAGSDIAPTYDMFAANPGVVSAQVAAAVAGVSAAMSMAANEGSVATLRIANIAGEPSTLALAAHEAVASVVRIVVVPGEPAEVVLVANSGDIAALRQALVSGEPAQLSLAANEGVIAALRQVLVSGEPALMTLVANSGDIFIVFIGYARARVRGPEAEVGFVVPSVAVRVR